MQSKLFALAGTPLEIFAVLCECLDRRASNGTGVETFVRVFLTETEDAPAGCTVVPLAPVSECIVRERYQCTPVQARVARLLAARLSNSEIAQVLGCTEGTVRSHLGWVYAKLGAHSRDDVIRILNQPPFCLANGGGDGCNHDGRPD